mgnify:CR=1 FL=1|jgi:uncharacterized membrane protein YedE/YeeE
MKNRMNLIGGLFGAGFGFVLAAARLHEYDTIHETLKFQSPYVFGLMGLAIGISLPLLWILERREVETVYGGRLSLSRSRIERHHIVGGALFGAGWSIAGTCPAPALAMLASGATYGAIAVVGLFIGLWLRDRQVAASGGTVSIGDGEHRDLRATAVGSS